MSVHRPGDHSYRYTLPATFSTLIDYVSGTNPIYVGLAPNGSATSTAVWQIHKIAYDGNNNPTSVLWANGNDLFDQVWDNRSSLTYS